MKKRNYVIFGIAASVLVGAGVFVFLGNVGSTKRDVAMQTLGETEVRSRLASSEWCSEGSGSFGSSTVVRFTPNEVFYSQNTSDVVEKLITGNWRYDQVSETAGYVTQSDETVRSTYTFFSDENTLWMGGRMYRACERKIQGKLPEVQQTKPELARLFVALSGKSFTKVSHDNYMNQVTGNNIAIPKHFLFEKDGSVEVSYSTNFGLCKKTGHWSASDNGVLQVHDQSSHNCLAYKVTYLDVFYPVIEGRKLKLGTLEADFAED